MCFVVCDNDFPDILQLFRCRRNIFLGTIEHLVCRKMCSKIFENRLTNQRTNGPVNAHLRSAVYTNVKENSPSIGADEALGPFFFSE